MKRIASAALAVSLGSVGGVAVAEPAAAGSSDIAVCNSSASVARIQVSNLSVGEALRPVDPGRCTVLYDGNGGVRVAVLTPSGGGYKIKPQGATYGPIHCLPNTGSNPPHTNVWYRVKSSCGQS